MAMVKMTNPALPDRVIEVDEQTVAVHAKSGWIASSTPATAEQPADAVVEVAPGAPVRDAAIVESPKRDR